MNLKRNFHWAKAILRYCRDTQVKSTALQLETIDFTSDSDEGETYAWMYINCIPLMHPCRLLCDGSTTLPSFALFTDEV